jgi:hypothetical protein
MEAKPERGVALVKILVPIAIVVFVIAGLYYLLIDPYTSRVVQARMSELLAGSPPKDLESARFLLTPSNGGGIYTAGSLMYEDYAKDGSIVADIAESEGILAKIAYAPDGMKSRVFVDGKEIISSQTIKRSLTLSPNGRYVAYSEKDPGTEAYQHAQWRVQVVEVATGVTTEHEGFAVMFVSDAEMLVAKADGVYGVNIASGEDQKLIDRIFAVPHKTSIAVSNTYDMFAWVEADGEIRQAKTYSVRFSPDWFVAETGSFTGVYGSVAVTQDHLYVLAQKGETVELRQYPVTGGESVTVRTFPTILSVHKLLP